MTKQIKVIFDLTFSIGDFGLSSNFFISNIHESFFNCETQSFIASKWSTIWQNRLSWNQTFPVEHNEPRHLKSLNIWDLVSKQFSCFVFVQLWSDLEAKLWIPNSFTFWALLKKVCWPVFPRSRSYQIVCTIMLWLQS